MTTSTSRRSFLHTAGLATGAAVVGARTAAAAEPVRRVGGPRMKLSLAAYSFNRLLKRSPKPEDLASADMTLADFVDYCAELDLEGTELTGYYFPKFPPNPVRKSPVPTPEPFYPPTTVPGFDITFPEAGYLNSVKNHCFRLGLDVSGTAIGNDFCHPPGEARDGQIRMCKDWIDRAAILGAPVIRIFAGRVKSGQGEQDAIDLCVEGINECLLHAAGRGVFLALENHGGITATPDQMLRIVEAVDDSPWFGVNLDSGNFRTDDPYGDLARIAPYAINAQIKVMMTVAGEKRPADLPRTIGILKDAGYRGYVVLEYEERDDPEEHIPRYLDELRSLIDA